MDEWTDGDYPTEAALTRLEQWPYQDTAGALDFVKAIWHWPDFASHDLSTHEAAILHANHDDKYLRLATGGWSGNEDIVHALESNRMIHAIAWRLHAFGGLYIYQYPRADTGKYRIVVGSGLDDELHHQEGRVGGP
jgi:hypothetical protein